MELKPPTNEQKFVFGGLYDCVAIVAAQPHTIF